MLGNLVIAVVFGAFIALFLYGIFKQARKRRELLERMQKEPWQILEMKLVERADDVSSCEVIFEQMSDFQVAARGMDAVDAYLDALTALGAPWPEYKRHYRRLSPLENRLRNSVRTSSST